MSDQPSLRDAALDYHEHPKPGKLEIRATKPMATGRDLARAYSPGVAEACIEIKENPADAARYTARGNLVAVVSNGTAVLGLGNIGALASKPVMEGKAVLFKKFASIDCFDIEVDEAGPEKLADIGCALEPAFGAINLEDIKAPDCFTVERICRERMNIPVFHDDQHGTAIVVGAAVKNALHVAGKSFDEIKIVSTGGGAAGAFGVFGLAADIPTTITLALRTARLTGLCYGFGGGEVSERVFILDILQLAGANSAREKRAILDRMDRDRNEFSPETWTNIVKLTGQAAGTHAAMHRVAATLGVNLSARKIGQLAPVIGAAVGAGVGASFQNDIADAARHAYRARWLAVNEGLIEGEAAG